MDMDDNLTNEVKKFMVSVCDTLVISFANNILEVEVYLGKTVCRKLYSISVRI